MEWWPNVRRENCTCWHWVRISLWPLRWVSPSLWDSQLRFNYCVFVDDAIPETSSLPPTLKQRIDTRRSTKLRRNSRCLFLEIRSRGQIYTQNRPHTRIRPAEIRMNMPRQKQKPVKWGLKLSSVVCPSDCSFVSETISVCILRAFILSEIGTKCTESLISINCSGLYLSVPIYGPLVNR